MAESFVFNFGSLDLAPFVRMSPGEGWDPFDADFAEPVFAENPVREGAILVSSFPRRREMAWPLALNAGSKQALLDMVGDINREADKPGLRVEWRDVGAAASTFYDVVHARLEPDANFRRGEKNWLQATLRITVQPYGHTATERVVATAAASAALLTVPIPSPLTGDAAALLDARIVAGAALASGPHWRSTPNRGRTVMLAAIPAAYRADFDPSAMTHAGTVIGGSGAMGSQYLRAPIGHHQGAAALFFDPASAYVGRNRVLVLARSNSLPGPILTARLNDIPFGHTTMATAICDFDLVDLGVFSADEHLTPFSTLTIDAQPHPSGVAASSADFDINRVFVLPEHRTVVVRDEDQIAAHADFLASGPLASGGFTDLLGNPLHAAPGLAPLVARPEEGGYAACATSVLSGVVASMVRTQRMFARVRFSGAARPSGGYVALVPATQAGGAEARVGLAPSPYLALVGEASVALTAFPSAALYELACVGGNNQTTVQLRTTSRAPVAVAGATRSVASVGAVVQGEGGMALNIREPTGSQTVRAYDFTVAEVTNDQDFWREAGDQYRLDGVSEHTARYMPTVEGGLLRARLEAYQRGLVPHLAAPSAAGVFAGIVPIDGGPMNDSLAVTVRCRERFTFAR